MTFQEDKTTSLSPSPGVSDHILLSAESPEGFSTNLLLCNEPFPGSLVLDLAYLPYYRTSDVCISPSSCSASSHTLTEAEESSEEGKADTKQDEKSIPPSLELSKRTVSPPTHGKKPSQQLPSGASSSELCPPSSPSRLPPLSQPRPPSGYFPYYRTEGEICTGPAHGNGTFTGTEGPETKEGRQRGGAGFWSLSASCSVC
ncbi:putative protein FAM47C [Corapipo altera]|uniref:putative protein FAM47C n=1 Tax=Corapipo altera TaxID=415028 RepID=UPI000FD67DE1|nr:putative protein FAM47C [Corapipo altera]